MEITTLKQSPSKSFNFIHPYTGEETDIKVTVTALKSRKGNEATHNLQLAQLELQKDLKEGEEVPKGEVTKVTTAWIAEITESIENVTINGKKIKQTKEDFIKVYNESEELMDAVYKFASNLGNFKE